MRVNGGEIADDDFARAFTDVPPSCRKLVGENEAAGAVKKFFEFLTATGFHYFAQAGTIS